MTTFRNKVLSVHYTGWKIVPWLMCALGAVFYCYESLLRVSPSVMNVDLMMNYHINAAQLGNLIAFYYYIYAPMQLFVGMFMDRFGPRRLLALAALSCAIGTYFFAVSDHLLLAELGRFMVGFGSAFAFVGVLKLATIWLPPERFAVVSGSMMAIGMLGGMLGDVTLTALVSAEGWRHASYQAAVFGGFLVVFLFLILRDGRKKPVHHTEKVSTKEVFKGFRRLVSNPQVWINGAIGCLMWLPLSIFAETWGIFYLKQVHGFTATQAANANSLIFMGWAVGGPLVGMLSDHIRQRRLPMTIGAALAALIMSILLFVPELSRTTIYVMLFLSGLCSSPQVIIFAVAREISGHRAAGTALALTNMLVMTSGIIQPISGFLLEHADKATKALDDGAHIYSTHAYQLAMLILPASLLIAMIASFFLKETHCQDQVLAAQEAAN